MNLFADMSVQPATLQSGLVAATASTDTSPPTASITSPSDGDTVIAGVPLTVTGTATDSGGGRVAGVEVSTDGGATWHPASGHASWSYTFTPQTTGSLTIQARATDDSVNTGPPSTDVTVTVAPHGCPCTIWDNSATPASVGNNDGAADRLRRQVPQRRRRLDLRLPVLQEPGRQRHPHGPPVGHERQPAREHDVHQRDRVGMAAGRPDARRSTVTAGTTYIGSIFSSAGFYPDNAGVLRGPGRRQSAAARARGRGRRTERRVPRGTATPSPTRASTRATTGPTSCSRTVPTRHRRSSRRGARSRARRMCP